LTINPYNTTTNWPLILTNSGTYLIDNTGTLSGANIISIPSVITDSEYYIIIGNDNITIDGQFQKIEIEIWNTNKYYGLIQNIGYVNLTIQNIVIVSENTIVTYDNDAEQNTFGQYNFTVEIQNNGWILRDGSNWIYSGTNTFTSTPTRCTIQNCIIFANIDDSCGGIAGGNNPYTNITNCYAYVPNPPTYSGGIVGTNTPSSMNISYCGYIGYKVPFFGGGIAGFINYASISNCFNIGQVGYINALPCGGIAGMFNYGNITSCFNLGDLCENSAGICVNSFNCTIDSCYSCGAFNFSTSIISVFFLVLVSSIIFFISCISNSVGLKS
jgi:hypothetical protein